MNLKDLKYLTLKLTNRCNLNCIMCGQVYSSMRNSADEIDVGYIEKILEEASEVKHIYLYGGEPLMYTQVSKLLSLLYHKGKTVRITTNGTLLEVYAEELVNYKVANVEISMDSFHDDILEKVRGGKILTNIQNGINKLHEEKKRANIDFPYININCVLLPSNYKEMMEFAEYVEKHMTGVESVSFAIPVMTTMEMGKSYEKVLQDTFSEKGESWKWFCNKVQVFSDVEIYNLYKEIIMMQGHPRVTIKKIKSYEMLYNLISEHYELPERRCACPYAAITVLPNGDTTFCTDFPDVILGNIYCESIENIWLGERSSKFRKYLEEKGSFPICARCVHRDEVL